MGSLVSLLFSPTGVVIACCGTALWAAARPASRAARRAAVFTALAYLLASTYVTPLAVSKMLDAPYHRLKRSDVPPGRTAVVVLGAGVTTVFGWQGHLSVPTTVEAERVLETHRVYRLLAPEWLIASGGNASNEDESEPSSVNMKRVLVQLGVPPDRILLQSASTDTHEETQMLADMLRSIPAQHIVVVTSAVHMRRALGAFRAAGVAAVPAIAPDSESFESWRYFVLPTGQSLAFSGEVAHEIVGITYYWARGWWRP